MKHFLVLLSILISVAGASAQPRNPHHRHHSQDRYEYRESRHREPRHREPRHREPRHRKDIPCVKDWQKLWNGCHVRLLNGRVSVLDYDGDTVVRGDEVVLLYNGCYKVRVGDLWRIYDRNGLTTSISGHEILAWPEGLYCVRFSDFWRVYDSRGDRLTHVWGEYVEIYDRDLIRCVRNGRSYYYDFQGNERR